MYRQIPIPEEQVCENRRWNANNGWPLHWVSLGGVPIGTVDVYVGDFAAHTGISFEQSVDLGDGLGAKRRAVVEFPSGLRVELATYPQDVFPPGREAYAADWVYICPDPSTVHRPLIDGFIGEASLELYRDELIDEVVAELAIPPEWIAWRSDPQHQPPLTTEEGMNDLRERWSQAPRPRFFDGAAVRLRPRGAWLSHLVGLEAVVHAHLLHGPRPVASGVAEWAPGAPWWRYGVTVPSLGRAWLLWEDELEALPSIGEFGPGLYEA